MRFEFAECHGTLKSNGREQSLFCSVVVENDGKILIRCEDIAEVNETVWLLTLCGNGPVQFFEIELRDASDNVITSRDAYVVGHGTRTEAGSGTQISLTLSAFNLRFVASNPSTGDGLPKGTRVEFFTVGQMGAHCVYVKTPLGKLACNGPTKLDDYSAVAGIVSLETSEIVENEAWFEEADSLIERVLEIISFGQGRRTRWSVRRRFRDGRHLETLFTGPKATTPPRFPPQHFLHMQPIVATAVANYTEELRSASGLGEALYWYLMHPPYADAQFIAYFLTLEQLASSLRLKNQSDTFMDHEKFLDTVVPALESAIDEATSSLPSEQAKPVQKVFKDKLKGWNHRGLEAKISGMLDYYQVPLGNLHADLPKLVRIRNRIFHTGSIDSEIYGRHFSEYLRALREIATRTILTIIGFSGHYSSYLSGSEAWITFPPEYERK